MRLQGTCPPSFRESTSWIISPSKFWTATIFIHAHLQVVYYKCAKFHKNPISRLGGIVLTRYMPSFFSWKYKLNYLPFQILDSDHISSCTSAGSVLQLCKVSQKSNKPLRRSCAYKVHDTPFRESISWIISLSKFWTATIFLHAHLQVVYYKCVKFYKNLIGRLGGIALTRYMPSFFSWKYKLNYLPFQILDSDHISSCTSAGSVLQMCKVS